MTVLITAPSRSRRSRPAPPGSSGAAPQAPGGLAHHHPRPSVHRGQRQLRGRFDLPDQSTIPGRCADWKHGRAPERARGAPAAKAVLKHALEGPQKGHATQAPVYQGPGNSRSRTSRSRSSSRRRMPSSGYQDDDLRHRSAHPHGDPPGRDGRLKLSTKGRRRRPGKPTSRRLQGRRSRAHLLRDVVRSLRQLQEGYSTRIARARAATGSWAT